MILNWMRTSRNLSLFRKNKQGDGRNSLSRVAGAIVTELFKGTTSWPIELLSVYLDDALGCRQWVDAPELAILTKNLLEWTKYCDSSSTKPSFQESHLHDDSSGEEEILDSSTSSILTSPDTSDRFQGRHDEALRTVFFILAERCGIATESPNILTVDEYTQFILSSAPSTGCLMNTGGFLVSTMHSFCRLSPVRYLAAKCLSIWISNPALVEHVGRLLTGIGQGLLGWFLIILL